MISKRRASRTTGASFSTKIMLQQEDNEPRFKQESAVMGTIQAYMPRAWLSDLSDINAVSDAYDLAMLELPGSQPRLEELLARRIIALAAAGERDPVSLCDAALVGLLHLDSHASRSAKPSPRIAAAIATGKARSKGADTSRSLTAGRRRRLQQS
jgi:hypothetical protein